ncbi:MAG TPA: glycosyltransferase family 2 protein [Hyphomicrobiaceae bacterium]|jgi:glycosyltransferase involved in cell wall biosynthesis|nr:glycosyltransferase family 2 protein [Hyphomicrobiaceae bacterium]
MSDTLRGLARNEAVAREAHALSIVVPAKDEEESLPLVVARITAACRAGGHALRDIVLVDDGSSDNTWEVMSKLAGENDAIQAIRLRRNFGKATALMVGIGACRGDVIITMDADLQDDPEEISRFVETLDRGYDLVSGWKKERHDPLNKTVPSRLFNKVTATISGVKLNDFNCGFKAYRREIFDAIQLYGELHRYVPVLANALGYRIAEIPVRHHARRFGASKYGVARYLRGFLDLLTVVLITRFAYRPGHLFGGIGSLVAAGGGLALAYLIGLKVLTGASIGNRPLLLLGVLAVIVGVQLILFGMLAELIIHRTQRPIEMRHLVAAQRGQQRA